MGNDTSIVQAARVSYGKGTKKVSTDAGIIKYLMRHWHSTPFEMCEIKYHVKLPIFILFNVGFPTTTINEFRNKHCGRGGSTHHLHQFQLMGVN